MEPRVTKHEKRLDLRYELPHRVRCSATYPIPAPNGSSIIFYGYENGLRVLWRGGRRIRTPRPTQTPKPSDTDVIVLDDSDEEAPTHLEPVPQPEYEDEEEDSYDGQLNASIIHDITIPTSGAVSRISVPSTSLQWPSHANNDEDAIVCISTTDGDIVVFNIPLAPLATLNGQENVREIVAVSADTIPQGSFVRDLAIRFFGQAQIGVCLAAITDVLHLWRFELGGSPDDVQHTTITLDHNPIAVSFHPTLSYPQVLLTDVSCACRIFNPSREWAETYDINNQNAQGTWTATFHAPFAIAGTNKLSLPARKRTLDAQWVLNGRCILAIFDDGSWGIWDTTAASTSKPLDEFVITGYLDSAASIEVADAASAKRSGALLAPMTPNTRKSKSTALFNAPQSKPSAVAARGGISVSRTTTLTGAVDESVLIWYGGDVYAIPSIQTFWQRSTSGSSGLGSLYAPGVAHVSALELFHECISGLMQLPASRKATGGPKITRTPDFVLSAESRLIIVQHKVNSGTTLFSQKPNVNAELQDQRMLDAGELDLGGMDRILSTLTTNEGRRKVGFAH